MRRLLKTVLLTVAAAMAWPADAAPRSVGLAVSAYIEPYVRTNNFSGAVLIARDGVPTFARAYGYANRERRIPNRLDTRFHIASTSMQFTAAATLRLVNSGRLSLDTPVADVVPGYPNGGAITVRNLLTQTSGIADVNKQPGYAEVLKAHQTAASLVNKVRDLPLDHAPGTYHGEEHSAYNLLALIVERTTGLPFAAAVRKLVFDPLAMHQSGIDDDSPVAARLVATGYQPSGLYDLAPADRIHWSAKTGNASAYTTVRDELKFVTGAASRELSSVRTPRADVRSVDAGRLRLV